MLATLIRVRRCDVLVVGAGPAGSVLAAALCRARPELDVLVADRSVFPRDKPCGDGISPRAAVLLHGIGAGGVLDGYPPNAACRIVGPGGETVRSDGIPSRQWGVIAGHTIPRTVLDHRLLDFAIGAGAEFWPGARVTGTTLEPGWRTAIVREGARSVTVRARLLVGCDGAYSTVRRVLGAGKVPKATTSVAARAYLEWPTPDSGLRPIRFVFRPGFLPGYGWFFPISPTSANAGVGLSVARGRDLHQAVREFLAELAAADRTLDVPAHDLRAHLLPHDRPPLAFRRAALVGDAASMINPLSGEGIYYALRAGLMLTERLASVELADAGALGEALRGYEQAFRARFAKHYRSSRVARRVVSHERLCRAAIAAAAADPRSTEDAVSLLFGDGTTGTPGVARLLAGAARNAVRR